MKLCIDLLLSFQFQKILLKILFLSKRIYKFFKDYKNKQELNQLKSNYVSSQIIQSENGIKRIN